MLDPKNNKRAPISELLLSMNAIFDTQRIDGALQQEFRMTLDKLEKLLIVQMTGSVPPTALTNATYFFCKFQSGSENLWNMLEG